MASITKQVIASGESSLSLIPSVVNELSTLLGKFNKTPSELEKTFISSYPSSLDNPELKSLKNKLLDHTSTTLDILSSIQAWIQVLVPKVEDGGNFGVAIQIEFIKAVKTQFDDIVKILETVSVFHEKRSALVEKISPKVSTELKTTKTLKSIEKDKTGTTETESETRISSEVAIEQYQALSAIDIKLYLQLKASARMQRDALVLQVDFIEKNKSKIRDPRGTSTSYTY